MQNASGYGRSRFCGGDVTSVVPRVRGGSAYNSVRNNRDTGMEDESMIDYEKMRIQRTKDDPYGMHDGIELTKLS